MKMRKFFKIIIFGSVLLIFVGMHSPLNATARSIAVLAKINGRLDVNEIVDPGWRIANMGQMLSNGDRLRSGAEAWAAIFFLDGSQIKMHENSNFTIQSEREKERALKTTIKVAQGEMWMKVPPDKGSNFKIETPTSVASVKGTEFNLRVEQDGTTFLTVIEGSVEFLNELGRVLATEMTSCMAAQNEAPSAPQRVTRREVPSWDKEVRQDLKLVTTFSQAGDKEMSRPFNVDIEVQDIRSSQRSLTYGANILVTGDDENLLFSEDGGQTWDKELSLKTVKGKAVVKCKSLTAGTKLLLASGEDCAPAKLAVDVKLSEKRLDTMKSKASNVVDRLGDDDLKSKIAGKEYKTGAITKGSGNINDVLTNLESGKYEVLERTVIEEPDGRVKVFLRVKQSSE